MRRPRGLLHQVANDSDGLRAGFAPEQFLHESTFASDPPSLLPTASSSSESERTARSNENSSASIESGSGADAATARIPSSSIPATRSSSLDHRPETTTCSAALAAGVKEPKSAPITSRLSATSAESSARAVRSGGLLPMIRPASSNCSPVANSDVPGAAARASTAAASASLVAEPISATPSTYCQPGCALFPDASSSARNRSTIAEALLSSLRLSPMTPEARSIARVPTSERSDTRALWRSASICRLGVGGDASRLRARLFLRLATICVPSRRACSRMRAASERASASSCCTPQGRRRPRPGHSRLLDAALDGIRAGIQRLVKAGQHLPTKKNRMMRKDDCRPEEVVVSGEKRVDGSARSAVTECVKHSCLLLEVVRGFRAGNGMNATAIAMNARASVNAIPRNIRPCRRPWSSGWRATDSIGLADDDAHADAGADSGEAEGEWRKSFRRLFNCVSFREVVQVHPVEPGRQCSSASASWM